MKYIMGSDYSPVGYEYRESIQEAISARKEGKIFYFDDDQKLAEASGTIDEMNDVPGKGVFAILTPHATVRIDRIITIFGKPGPAFDEYEAYANACLSCTGGYELKE